MKTIRLLFLIASIFTLCSCEKEVVQPNNPQSTYSAPELVGYRITRITVQNFPYCSPNGTPYDGQYSNDFADLSVKIFEQGQLNGYTLPRRYDDPQASWTNLNIHITELDQIYYLRLQDYDDNGVVSAEIPIVEVGFNAQTFLDEPDNAFSTSLLGSPNCYPYGNQSWLRVYFELIYE